MFSTLLTPAEAKQARAAVGLSQSKVAQATGISRTNLALFEVKKYLLDDSALLNLKQFYQKAGYRFADASPVEQSVPLPAPTTEPPWETGLRLLDGYALPAGFPEDEAEGIVAKIHANDAEITALSGQKPGLHWWTEQPKTKGVNRLLALHARNYLLTRRLQGHEPVNNARHTEETSPEDVTNGMLFNDIVSA